MCSVTAYDGKYEIEETADFATYVPKVDERFMASLAVIPLRLLGYYVSVAKGLDVNKPRNLAKSVTVEQIEKTWKLSALKQLCYRLQIEKGGNENVFISESC